VGLLALYVKDTYNATDGFDDAGDWNMANEAPVNGTATPDSGSSAADATYPITTTYSDANGAANIASAYLLVNSTIAFNNGLYCYYQPSTNKLYLRNDANTAWLGGFTPGSANVISNSQGSLDCGTTTVSKVGNTLTINWSLSRKVAFAGTKNLYLKVLDNSNAIDNFEDVGDWSLSP
jgi:hypothetical protein